MSTVEGALGGMLTVYEAAKILGLRESTIRDWILRRRITFAKLGRSVRIPQSEIDRLIEASTIPAESHNARPGARKQ